MKYLRERKLAQNVMMKRLGYAPKLADIIPLESDIWRNKCRHVLFTIKGHPEIEYRANFVDDLIIDVNGKEIARFED